MANLKSAKKCVRKDKKRALVNLNRKSSVKSAVKDVLTAISKKEKIEVVNELMRNAEAQLSRAKNKILHPKTSSRKISRLTKKVNQYSETISE